MAAPPPTFEVPMESSMKSMDTRGIIVVTLWIRIIGIVIVRVVIRIGIAIRIKFPVITRIRDAGAQDDDK
jgi:hypothetical protein